MEIKKDIFGKNIIFIGGFPKGEIKSNGDIINNFGIKKGVYIGNNQGKDLLGFTKPLEEIIK